MPQKTLLECVADAIAEAQKVKAYGLYDYTNYPGGEPPHVVKYELAQAGETYEVARYTDADTAREHYEALCREFLARAALSAVNKWMAEDYRERMQRMGLQK